MHTQTIVLSLPNNHFNIGGSSTVLKFKKQTQTLKVLTANKIKGNYLKPE